MVVYFNSFYFAVLSRDQTLTSFSSLIDNVVGNVVSHTAVVMFASHTKKYFFYIICSFNCCGYTL